MTYNVFGGTLSLCTTTTDGQYSFSSSVSCLLTALRVWNCTVEWRTVHERTSAQLRITRWSLPNRPSVCWSVFLVSVNGWVCVERDWVLSHRAHFTVHRQLCNQLRELGRWKQEVSIYVAVFILVYQNVECDYLVLHAIGWVPVSVRACGAGFICVYFVCVCFI